MRFKQFFLEDKKELDDYPTLHNFMQHLVSGSHVPEHFDGDEESEDELEDELKEAKSVADIKDVGIKTQPKGNVFQHLRTGFNAAFPKGESPDQTKRKALEARKHFRKFMSDRGGHADKNNLQILSQNGKTRLSSGVGVNTVGLSLAPHVSSGYKFNACPKASTECAKTCLGFTAGGNKQYPEASFRAKLLRHQYIHEYPEQAARLISHEITENEKWCAKNKMKSGVRLNVTSDLPFEHLMPQQFFDRHTESQFYDYTKIHGRLSKDLPKNYSLALSHTGANHDESNDQSVVDALENGQVVAMVYQKGKVKPTHVLDVKTGKKYPVVDGDSDDNVYDRHKSAGVDKSQGVVSGLKLKGVKNEAAGNFANKVDDDGIIRINAGKSSKLIPTKNI